MTSKQAEIQKIVNAIFQQYDADKNGTLQMNEVVNALNNSSKGKVWTPAQVSAFISRIDTNNDNKISKSELLNIFKKIIQ